MSSEVPHAGTDDRMPGFMIRLRTLRRAHGHRTTSPHLIQVQLRLGTRRLQAGRPSPQHRKVQFHSGQARKHTIMNSAPGMERNTMAQQPLSSGRPRILRLHRRGIVYRPVKLDLPPSSNNVPHRKADRIRAGIIVVGSLTFIENGSGAIGIPAQQDIFSCGELLRVHCRKLPAGQTSSF